MSDGKISLVPSQNMYRVAEPLSIRPSSPHVIPMSPEPRAVLFLPGASSSKPSKVDFQHSSLFNVYPEEGGNLLCVFAGLFEMSFEN